MPEVWQVSKSNPDKVARYAGADKNVVFPSEIKGKKVTGVASVTKKVPDNYREIVSVVLPEGYTTIGDYAFFGCENLESITLPSTLVTISPGHHADLSFIATHWFVIPNVFKDV